MRPVLVAGVLLAAVLLSHCGSVAVCPYPESILFSDAFSAKVYLACPDGSVTRPFLSRTSEVGFEEAAGTSLQAAIVATVDDETSPEPTAAEHLDVYEPLTGKLSVFPNLPGDPGWYAMSPDGSHVAFEYVPNPRPGELTGLWIADLTSGSASPLLNFPQGIQMNAPAWRPDGREILFIQLDLTSLSRVKTTLVAVSYPGGQTRVLFGPEDGVAGVAFDPDAKNFALWSSGGLEIVGEDALDRTMVLPVSKLGGRQLGTPGLIWGGRDNLIAFVLYDPETNQSQLWDVRPDGTGLREIYAASGGKLVLGSFVTGSWSAARTYPPS